MGNLQDWSVKELMLLNCGVGEDSWESFGLLGDPTSPFLRRSALGFLWKEDAKAETPVLWPSHEKSWLIGKDSDAGTDWGKKERTYRTTLSKHIIESSSHQINIRERNLKFFYIGKTSVCRWHDFLPRKCLWIWKKKKEKEEKPARANEFSMATE